jgi:hypothetical protein
MQFNFPKPKTKESVWVKLDNEVWRGIEEAMRENNITQEEALSTIISQAWYSDKNLYACSYKVCPDHEDGIFLREELIVGENGGLYCSLACLKKETQVPEYKDVVEDKPKQKFSVKRDYLEAGDNRRKEISGEDFDGGGDRRTKEAKEEFNEFGHKIVGWSYKYDKCQSCGSTEKKHMAKGLCGSCYVKQHAKKSPEDKAAYQKEYYQENKDESVAMKKERRAVAPEEVKEKEKETKHEYYVNHPEKFHKKKAQEIEIEKLPKEWWKKENLEGEGSYLYCANGNCKKYKFGKFLKGMETLRDNKVFCSIICANEVFPIRQPLPDNFTYAYCQYLLCPKKKYIRDEGIEEGGKNFCSDKCYEYWLESIKSLSAVN